jgi:phosphoglycerate dehydrogenase-like enzyme
MRIVLLESGGRFAGLEDALKAFPGAELRRASDPAAIAAELPEAEILIASNRLYTAENAAAIRANAKSLRWIQFSTSGIDGAAAQGLPTGVTVTNASGLRAFAVAEHAIALMFGLVRQLGAVERAKQDNVWRRDEIAPTTENLSGKHLVLVGLGAIGQEIARKAKAFDMTVTGISRTTDAIANVDRIRPRSELQAAAAQADIVCLAAISDAETEKILSRAVIGAMKPSAYVINIARGQLIDGCRFGRGGEGAIAGRSPILDAVECADHAAYRRRGRTRPQRRIHQDLHRQPAALGGEEAAGESGGGEDGVTISSW